MANTVTVGSRVQIACGKQSASTTNLISGLVRKKGYARGSNGRILYTISGSSTGIRLNEIITYVVSEASKLNDGVTINTADPSRYADTLLANSLSALISDGVLNIANLAANSDVETFIASLSVEFGELQEVVNYISSQSGGEVIVDTNDLVNFRYEIKNNLFGRGFTIKNTSVGKADDDADDTMYLRGRAWSYEDDFFKSSEYSNLLSALLQPEQRPSSPEDLGFTAENNYQVVSTAAESAVKFRPTHSHFIPGDIYVVGAAWSTVGGGSAFNWWARICQDSGGVPKDAGGIVVNILFDGEKNWSSPTPTTETGNYHLGNVCTFFSSSAILLTPQEFSLDTSKDYWFIMSNRNAGANERFSWGQNANIADNTGIAMRHISTFSTDSAGGGNWSQIAAGQLLGCFAAGRYRSNASTMRDPKAMQSVQSGITGGQGIASMIPEAPIQIKTKESMYRHIAGKIYDKARPRTMYNFPTVVAPNIPPLPGDPIVIDDTVLGFSEPGNQVVITTCGDMTYQWGSMGSGNYQAPTILNINALGVHPRYR